MQSFNSILNTLHRRCTVTALVPEAKLELQSYKVPLRSDESYEKRLSILRQQVAYRIVTNYSTVASTEQHAIYSVSTVKLTRTALFWRGYYYTC